MEGTFSVPITATNFVGTDTQTLVITIGGLPPPTNSTSNTLIDSDGDGFPDEIETALGSDPNNYNSTPTGAPAVLSTISLSKLAIALNFKSASKDTMTYSGSVTLPQGFTVSGKLFYIDIGGVVKHFALDASGKDTVGSDSAKLLARRVGKVAIGAQTVSLQLSFKNGSFATQLTDEGMTNATVIGKPVTVPVVIFLDGILYKASVAQTYTAKTGGTARSKNP